MAFVAIPKRTPTERAERWASYETWPDSGTPAVTMRFVRPERFNLTVSSRKRFRRYLNGSYKVRIARRR